MVVEDDADLQEALSEALQEEGYRVRSASNGSEALQKLSSDENRPNLIVLDLMMPMMNGWDFLDERSRRSDLSRIPVLVLTASSSACPSQAAVVLRKPVQPAKLFETVRQALGARTNPSVARPQDLPT